jgi:hypothetical protein
MRMPQQPGRTSTNLVRLANLLSFMILPHIILPPSLPDGWESAIPNSARSRNSLPISKSLESKL